MNIQNKNLEKLKDIKCFMLDMDGTLYLQNKLFDFTNPFLETLRAKDLEYIFITNNSSLSSEDYNMKLAKLNVEIGKNGVFTSGDATKVYLKNKGYERIYLMGTPSIENDYEEEGFVLTEDNPDAVVLGFDKTLNYEKMITAGNLLQDGKPFIATHPDFVCPYKPHPIVDVGSMIKLFEATTGVSPKVIGKPNATMFEPILEKYNIKKEEIAMVGDRIYTDVRFGKINGFTSILVLSGESTMKTVEESDIEPDYIFENVGELARVLKDM